MFIWVDYSNKARELRAILGHRARPLQSPNIYGEKWDANKMLQAGVLASFLSQLLEVPCQGRIASRCIADLAFNTTTLGEINADQ